MNGIVCVNNNINISFNSRFLRIQHPETFPKEVLNAVQTNNGIFRFIREGQPSTFLERILDMFKKDEYLDVSYQKFAYPKNNLHHPEEELSFKFGVLDENKSLICSHSLDITASRHSSTKKSNRYQPYIKTPSWRILEAFEKIKDFKKKLTEKSYAQHINV